MNKVRKIDDLFALKKTMQNNAFEINAFQLFHTFLILIIKI